MTAQRDRLGVTVRRNTHGGSETNTNLPYDPTKQLTSDAMSIARDVLLRMLDGGELLTTYEGPWLRQAVTVLDASIEAANKRAAKANRG